MRGHCHRCNADLRGLDGESIFCPHCGAPQLRVIEENVVPAQASTPDGASTGALPPPNPGRVLWSSVVACAAIVAGIAAVLTLALLWLPAIFPIVWLWTVSGAVVVLGLYQRRHPETIVTPSTGARVGLVYGLLACAALALVTASAGLIARYGLHNLATFDARLTDAMHQVAQQQAQQAQQSGQAALDPDQLRLLYAPEFRAAVSILACAILGAFLIAFSTLGGAIGGMMRMRRR